MSIIGKIVELVTTETGVLDKSIEMLDKAEEKLQTKSEKINKSCSNAPSAREPYYLIKLNSHGASNSLFTMAMKR